MEARCDSAAAWREKAPNWGEDWHSGLGELYGDLDQVVAVEMEKRSRAKARKILEQRCSWGNGCGYGPGLCWPPFLLLQTPGGP